MKIVGIDGLSTTQVNDEIARGGRFVYFQYCLSIVVMTFKRPSDIYFIRAGESAVSHGLRFSLVSLLFGWWGIPWGPIYTIGSFVTNFQGGKDVTQQVIASASRSAPMPAPPTGI